jgi:uncharacterized surface protein with fasciclin (FAS1) repeats
MKKINFKTHIMKTKKNVVSIFAVAYFGIAALTMNAQTVMVGGEQMYPKKNIIENAINSKAHTTLVAAVKAADLVSTLQGPGPFTVFAPVNDAFENLPAGTVESLLKPESKSTLAKVLTYHVIAGEYDFNALSKAIKTGGGKSVMKTVNGGSLTFMMNGEHNITIMDEGGGTATISTYDVYQSNGVIQVIDKVLMQKM